MAQIAIDARTESVRKIKAIIDKVNDEAFKGWNVHQVRVRNERFAQLFASLEEHHQLAVGQTEGNEAKEQLRKEFNELEEKVMDTRAIIEERTAELEQAANLEVTNNLNQTIGAQNERPCLAQNVANTWGTFNGEALKWFDFKARFKLAVNDVDQIKPELKMQFLRQALIGSAEQVALGFTITAEHYEELWQALIDKYEDKYAMACAYLTKFFGLPQLPASITSGDLDRMVTTTNEMLRQVREMKYKTENWDLIVVHALQERLTPGLKKEWGDAHKGNDAPKIEEMLKFLAEQSKNIGSADIKQAAMAVKAINSRVNKLALKAPGGAASGGTPNAYKCGVCQNPSHQTNECSEFRGLTYDDRKRTAALNRLCFICLKRGHFSQECFNMQRCQEVVCKSRNDTAHHEMLCPMKGRYEYAQVVYYHGSNDNSGNRKRSGDSA